MNASFWQRLDVTLRSITPFLSVLILVVLGQIPLHIPGFAEVVPILPLMAVYHWVVYRPELMPASAAFFAGLLQDVLSGMPFGINAVVFVLVHMVIVSQHVFFQGKSFMIIWLVFALVAAGAVSLLWVLTMLYFSAFSSMEAAFFQYVISVGGFPILAWLLGRWQRAVLGTV